MSHPGTPGIPPQGGTRPWWAALLVLLPVTVVFIRHWTWAPSADSGDYAQYLLHARAILDGRGYGDIGYIYHPVAWLVGPRSFPPGLPLALTPIVAAFGFAEAPLRLFSIAVLCGFVVIAYRRLAVDVEPWQAWAAAAFTALAIESRLGTIAPISDPPFCLLVWATIVAVDRRGPWSVGRVALVTLLGFAAIAFRTAGVALLPALVAYAALHRSESRWRPAIPAAIWTGAGAIAFLLGMVRNPYSGAFAQTFDPAERLATIARNYRLTLFEVELYPLGAGRLSDAYHVAATVLAVIGLLVLVPRVWRSFVFVFTLAYVAMLAASPFSNVRYTWPLFPVFALAFVAGLGAVTGRWLPAVAARRLAVGLLVLITLASLHGEWKREPPFAITNTPDSDALYHWLREENRTARVRAMYQNPRVVTLHAGVPAMAALPVTTPGQLVAIDQRRITHVIWQSPDQSNCVQRWLNRLLTEFPDRFTLAWGSPTFRVYRVVPAAVPFTGEFKVIPKRSGLCEGTSMSGL